MFKVGQVCDMVGGKGQAVILSVDSPTKYGKIDCPVVAAFSATGKAPFTAVYMYDTEGNYCGIKTKGYEQYSIVSDEPSSEEQELINMLTGIPGLDERERSAAMLKAIRQLRKK